MELPPKSSASMPSDSEKSALDMEHKGYLQLNYPLFKKGRWFSSISSLKIMEKSLKNPETQGLWRGQINWGYSQSLTSRF